MVGGVVVKVVPLMDKVWVNCEETDSAQQCAIYVERNDSSLKIRPGDSLWWQGAYAMWTPFENRGKPNGKAGVDYDRRILRIGNSGVAYPTMELQAT